MDREVTLMEMLEAREARAGRQRELLEEHRCPLVSFTLNIAGPMKNSGRGWSGWRLPWLPVGCAPSTRRRWTGPPGVRPFGL